MTARYFLSQIPGLKKKEALELKEAIGKAVPPGNAQHDKIRQVAFNLKQNPKLLKRLSGPAIVALTDEEWRNLNGANRNHFMSSRDTLKTLLSIETLDEEGLAQNAPMLICRQCKGSEINFESVQTRGADEAATIFCFCRNPKCLYKWTMH